MKPYKIENGVGFFALYDVEMEGCPSLHGYTNFVVIDKDPVYVYDNFDENPGYTLTRRPPHLYHRQNRFRNIVIQLLGYRMCVAKKVLQSSRWLDMVNEISDIHENYWFECRRILRNHKFTRYYNCIPAIVREYCYFKEKVVYSSTVIQTIMDSFDYIERAFKENHEGRKYFPNLRYIALKIMELHEIPLQINIPFLITKSKLKSLDVLFKSLSQDLLSNVEPPRGAETHTSHHTSGRESNQIECQDLYHQSNSGKL